jgi:HEAT repeat protein
MKILLILQRNLIDGKMIDYLNNLIERMLDRSDDDIRPYDSSKTISWKALREAEKLDDKSFIPQLIEFINIEKDKNKRDKAYFTLGKIAKNTNDKQAMEFLISRIDKEKDKYVISSLLDRIADLQKTEGTDILPIINSVKSAVWQVRHSAVTALKNTKNRIAEDTLIEILKETNDEYDLWYVICSLSNIGTEKSLPYLLNLVSHKKQDVSGSALNAIDQISGAKNLQLYIEQLEKGKNKFTALLAVIKYGDENVIPNVIKRIKELVAKKRTRLSVSGRDSKTELIHGLEFLKQFTDDEEIKKLFDFLSTKKQDMLWQEEQEWLKKNK